MRNSWIFGAVFYIYSYGKFHVWFLQRKQDGSPKGLLSVWERFSPEQSRTPNSFSPWRYQHKSGSMWLVGTILACMSPHSNYKSPRCKDALFETLPSPFHFIPTLKRNINFKGNSITINTNTMKRHQYRGWYSTATWNVPLVVTA